MTAVRSTNQPCSCYHGDGRTSAEPPKALLRRQEVLSHHLDFRPGQPELRVAGVFCPHERDLCPLQQSVGGA